MCAACPLLLCIPGNLPQEDLTHDFPRGWGGVECFSDHLFNLYCNIYLLPLVGSVSFCNGVLTAMGPLVLGSSKFRTGFVMRCSPWVLQITGLLKDLYKDQHHYQYCMSVGRLFLRFAVSGLQGSWGSQECLEKASAIPENFGGVQKWWYLKNNKWQRRKCADLQRISLKFVEFSKVKLSLTGREISNEHSHPFLILCL